MLTRSVDPNGWRLCAHVIACGLNASPLAVRRPLYEYGYNDATPASAAIDSLIAGSPRTSAASAKDRRDIMCPRTRTSYQHAKHATARYSCEKKARMGRPYGSNWSGGNVRAELGDEKGHRWAMKPATNATSLESPHLTASAVARAAASWGRRSSASSPLPAKMDHPLARGHPRRSVPVGGTPIKPSSYAARSFASPARRVTSARPAALAGAI